MPSPIDITEESLTGLADKVVVISGGSAGIGFSTAKLLLNKGAKVVIGDINEPPKDILDDSSVIYQKTDVTSWKDLCALFRQAKNKHGRIDHVFCNAGTAGSADYLDESVDRNGDPVEPSRRTIEVDLMGMVNMAKLGIFYMKKQPEGGSIVLNSSGACLLRGLVSILHSKFPIRVNGLAPAWTDTAIVEKAIVRETKGELQSPEFVVRTAVLLMADRSRNGQLLLSSRGRCVEVEQAMLEANTSIIKELLAQ
ncbi:hypothetical protein McanMca71_003653 [Microsporum canis]